MHQSASRCSCPELQLVPREEMAPSEGKLLYHIPCLASLPHTRLSSGTVLKSPGISIGYILDHILDFKYYEMLITHRFFWGEPILNKFQVFLFWIKIIRWPQKPATAYTHFLFFPSAWQAAKWFPKSNLCLTLIYMNGAAFKLFINHPTILW